MLQWLQTWRARRRASAQARAHAWSDASAVGPDGFTTFQRGFLTTLEPVTGPLELTFAGTEDRYLTGSLPGTDLTLFLYVDEAQVSGAKGRFIAEKWDYDTPQALIDRVVSHIQQQMQSNQRLERP